MRKTLLIAAATLAASIISSQAQVYSQNIVGYVNVPAVNGFTVIANPLVNAGGDAATNFVNNSGGAWDGSLIYTWNGTGYSIVQYDSTRATGFANFAGSAAVPAPVLDPGQGFLFNNQSGSSNTITFVGTVYTGGPGASTNVVGLSTNLLTTAHTYQFVSSAFPVGGGISSVLGLTNPGGVLDGSLILVPNIVGGAVHGYVTVQFDSSRGTGFANFAGSAAVPEPIIPVGSGFLFSNQSGAPYNWIQSL